MKFNLFRQKIDLKLSTLGHQKIKQDHIDVPQATKKNLKELAYVQKKIQKNGLPPHLVLKKLKKELGYGIFLHPKATPILKGEVIAPYSGEAFLSLQSEATESSYIFSLLSELHLTREEQLIWSPKYCYHPRRLYAIDLDAKRKGNFTRFINHSEKPNIEAKLVRIPPNVLGLPPAPFEMLYIAKKTIYPGEQLLISYESEEEKSYWGSLNIKPFPMTPKTFQLSSQLKVITTSPKKP